MKAAARMTVWLVAVVGTGLASLVIVWDAGRVVDYGYRGWHSVLDIDALVADYAPRNARSGFETTTVDERARLFGEIVQAIHSPHSILPDAGDPRLLDLNYYSPEGQVLGRFLTHAEIVHLEDVRRLVQTLRPVGYAGGLSALIAVMIIRVWRLQRPRLVYIGLVFVALIASQVVTVLAVGPVRVFYTLHEWVFPPEHQWYFPYAESLMTTAMHAPHIFLGIGLVWLVLAAAIFIVALFGLTRLCSRAARA